MPSSRSALSALRRLALHGSYHALKVPMIPFGSSSVTRMNSAPSMNSHYRAADQEGDDECETTQHEQRRAGAVRLNVEAQNVLEIGQAVVAAKTEIVAEERQQQRIGHRLRDDREIDAGDAGAERQPAEA